MNQDPVTVRNVDWSSVFPGLLLLRAVRIACSVQVLVPSLLLVILAEAGMEFKNSTGLAVPTALDSGDGYIPALARYLPTLFSEPLVMQWRLITRQSPSFFSELFLLMGWLTIMACPCVAIMRMTSNVISRRGRTGVLPGFRYSVKAWSSIAVSTLIGVLILIVACSANWLTAKVAEIPRVGDELHALAFPIAFVIACVTVIGSFVFCIAWLLGLGAIGSDRCDGADALSRCLSYVLSHTVTTVCYLAVVWLIAFISHEALGIVVSESVTFHQGHLSDSVAVDVPTTLGDNPGFAMTVRMMWFGLIRHIPGAFQVAIILVGSNLTYLLLRKKEDGIRIDQQDDGIQLAK